jgi:hypothetical protein
VYPIFAFVFIKKVRKVRKCHDKEKQER